MKINDSELSNYKIVPIDSVKPYGDNPFKMSETTKHMIKASIEKFKFNVPLVVDQKNTIASGNKRWAVMKEMGYENVVVLQRTMTKAKFEGYLLMDNKSNKYADEDEELMNSLYESIGRSELEDFGIEEAEIEARLLADLEDINAMGDMETDTREITVSGDKDGTKMIQLFFKQSNIDQFMNKVEFLANSGENMTDTIDRVVRAQYEINKIKAKSK